MKKLWVFFVFFNTLQAMEIVRVEVNEGDFVDIFKEYLMMSPTFKNFIQDPQEQAKRKLNFIDEIKKRETSFAPAWCDWAKSEEASVINLEGAFYIPISSDLAFCLNKVLGICYDTFYKNNQNRAPSKNELEVFRLRLDEFLDDQNKLYSILVAAEFLDIPVLYEESKRMWAEKELVPCGLEIDMAERRFDSEIACRMKEFNKLYDDISSWHGNFLETNNISLLKQSLKPHRRSVWSVAFRNDGKYVACGYYKGRIVIYNIAEKTFLSFKSGHLNVCTLQYTPDNHIWSSGAASEIILSDARDGSKKKSFEDERLSAFIFQYVPMKNIIVSDTYRDLWVCNLESQRTQIINAHNEGLNSIGFSRDDSLCVTASYDQTVKVWDAGTWEQKSVVRADVPLMNAVINRSKDLIACSLENGDILLFDREKNEFVRQLKNHTADIWSLVFVDKYTEAPLMISGSKDYLINIWDVRARDPLVYTLARHTAEVQSIDFHENSWLLASAGRDKTVQLWDMRKFVVPLVNLRQEIQDKCSIKLMKQLEDVDNFSGSLTLEKRRELIKRFSPRAQDYLKHQLVNFRETIH